jgi:hypothetical protein
LQCWFECWAREGARCSDLSEQLLERRASLFFCGTLGLLVRFSKIHAPLRGSVDPLRPDNTPKRNDSSSKITFSFQGIRLGPKSEPMVGMLRDSSDSTLVWLVLAVLIILGQSRFPPSHRPEQTVAWRGLVVGAFATSCRGSTGR